MASVEPDRERGLVVITASGEGQTAAFGVACAEAREMASMLLGAAAVLDGAGPWIFAKRAGAPASSVAPVFFGVLCGVGAMASAINFANGEPSRGLVGAAAVALLLWWGLFVTRWSKP